MFIALLMPGPLLRQARGTRALNSTYRVICTTEVSNKDQSTGEVTVRALCYRSMKKAEKPHSLSVWLGVPVSPEARQVQTQFAWAISPLTTLSSPTSTTRNRGALSNDPTHVSVPPSPAEIRPREHRPVNPTTVHPRPALDPATDTLELVPGAPFGPCHPTLKHSPTGLSPILPALLENQTVGGALSNDPTHVSVPPSPAEIRPREHRPVNPTTVHPRPALDPATDTLELVPGAPFGPCHPTLKHSPTGLSPILPALLENQTVGGALSNDPTHVSVPPSPAEIRPREHRPVNPTTVHPRPALDPATDTLELVPGAPFGPCHPTLRHSPTGLSPILPALLENQTEGPFPTTPPTSPYPLSPAEIRPREHRPVNPTTVHPRPALDPATDTLELVPGAPFGPCHPTLKHSPTGLSPILPALLENQTVGGALSNDPTHVSVPPSPAEIRPREHRPVNPTTVHPRPALDPATDTLELEPGAPFGPCHPTLKHSPTGLSPILPALLENQTSCSPFLRHECDGNSYLNGICYQYNSRLQLDSNFTTGFQECTKQEVNLVFLFDGSESMTTDQFNFNKDLIVNIMTKPSNSSIKFAAVQFSKFFRTVFDFNDYQNNLAKEKLMKEPHMYEITNTHGAIKYTLDKLFNNVSSGVNPNATKAMVIITDGDPSDVDYDYVIKSCDEQNILRYMIGVGDVNLSRLKLMASEPKDNNTFYIDNYNRLLGLFNDLQKKIYNIKGSHETNKRNDRQNFESELSHSGFSVVYHTTDSVIVGSVGSYNWRGVLYEVRASGFIETEIKDPAVNNYSYMGYSAVIGSRGNVSLLISGAPRAEHKGMVTLFHQNNNTWTVKKNIIGIQIGSYFGASLNLLDIDSDGESDFLLVGAPLYYRSQPRGEGRLYIYTLSEKSFLKMMNMCESNAGRFAASLASLKDLNGDGLSDVAVGAPLEDEGTGVVYIYLGDKMHGINLKYSPQRISARSVLPGLQQFGISVVGEMDMNNDNLTDVVIGARGGIVLLKARPVMFVSSQLSFSPSKIRLNDFTCSDVDLFHAFTLTSCFTVFERTSSTGSLNKGLKISLNINLDVEREINRGFFKLQNSRSRSLQKSILLVFKASCFNFSIFMPRCVFDTVTPLKIQMNFSQTELSSDQPSAILDIHSTTGMFVEVPFERSCNSDRCVPDLKLNFRFINETLLVVNQAYFMVLITLANKGDNSYNNSIVLHYPEGLSLSKFDAVKSDTRSSCGDRDGGAMKRTTCSINLPGYRSNIETEFLATFRVTNRHYDWPDMMDIIIIADSDNNGNTTNATVKRSIPVQFVVDLAISLVSEYSVTYLNLSLEDRRPKSLSITYKVENLGLKSLPVSVTLLLACSKTHVMFTPESFGINEVFGLSNLTQCKMINEKQDGYCGKFQCDEFHLETSAAVNFTLTAQATLQNKFESRFSFHEFSYVFNIIAHLNYNRSRYNQMMTGLKDDPSTIQTTVRVEFVILPSRLLIICTGAGGGLILLIIILVVLLKSGFFRRNRPEELNTYGYVLESKYQGDPFMHNFDENREETMDVWREKEQWWRDEQP
nr:integrin alpha-M-like [Misgurnus anguillicaudatus]